jgi:glyoxylase-like metal-dependent hydrolase (beta-lactamase superfamily II)
MRLTQDVLLVGGGNFGFNLSHHLDCHVYLIDGGDELALVDTGIGGHHGESETILKNIKTDGVDVSKISTLLLTHYHTVTPFDTPGHCRGHVSLLVEGGDRRYLISGDLVFAGGTIIAQNIPDCSIQEYSASVKKMAQVEFDAFLPGHFSISLRDGKRHLDAAARQFDQLLIPRNAF